MSTLKGGRKAANEQEAANAIKKTARQRANAIKKAARESWDIENKGLNGLLTWCLRADNLEAYLLPYFDAQVAQGFKPLKPANINKGLIKFGFLHETARMQEGLNYLPQLDEQGKPVLKRLFSINYIFTLIARRAKYGMPNEEFAKEAAKAKAAYLLNKEAAIERAQYIAALIAQSERAERATVEAAQIVAAKEAVNVINEAVKEAANKSKAAKVKINEAANEANVTATIKAANEAAKVKNEAAKLRANKAVNVVA